MRFWSFAESHPFQLIWWDEDSNGKAVKVFLLAKTELRFTRVLAATSYESLCVLLDGPYGQCKDFTAYDSAVMICTGVGIAACLLYVRQILSHCLRASQKTPY